MIAALLISMLQTINSLVANKLISINGIDYIGASKVIEENSNKELRTEFFISRAKLASAKLRHAFTTALILYYFDLKCDMMIETDV